MYLTTKNYAITITYVYKLVVTYNKKSLKLNVLTYSILYKNVS